MVLSLRAILKETELEEKLKWGMPTYCLDGENIVGLGSFKAYAGLWFFNGSFLSDSANVLYNAQNGKTKAMRQWRFSSLAELDKSLIKKYLQEAIQNQKEGRELVPERKEFFMSDELKKELLSNENLRNAFENLTEGKQKEYAEYIQSAKREETKQSRIKKIIPMIEKGIGLNDKYR